MTNRVFEFIRAWWVKAQLKAPPFVKRAVMPRLHEAKELARLLIKPYLPVYQLQGQGQGGPLTVTFVGLEYSKPALTNRLFVEKPVEERMGQIPFWRYSQLAALSSSDIVIVEAAKQLIRKLPRQNAVVLPELVRHILDIQGDWEGVKGHFHRTVRNDLRLTRKYDYQCEISYEDQGFETFYRDMYLPTMEIRHGDLSSPMPLYEAYQYFRQGFLFFVKRNGQRVGGGICHVEQEVVQFIILGVLNGNEQLIKEGAVGALNILRVQWSNQQGYKAVDFLGSGPYLKSGLFQYKRKWGTTIYIPPHLHRRIWIKVNHTTPAVSRFLTETPLVVVDQNGKLYGLIVVDDLHNVTTEARCEWATQYATPGLSSVVVRSVSNFAEEPGIDGDDELVIPIASSPGASNEE